jgi:hypothetical protein
MAFQDKAQRQLAAQAEMAEMEALMQAGPADPTQSSEDRTEGSPDVPFKETAEQAFVAPEAVVDPFASTQTQEPVQDIAYWKDRALVSEKRFNVSKPKYDSNIYKLRTENSQLQADKIALSKQVNTLRQTAVATQTSPVDNMLSSKQVVDVLGQETADAIRQSIVDTNARVDAQATAQADKEISDAEARLKTSVDARYNEFIRVLTELVPDQGVIDKDPAFIAYLKEPDEHIGVERFELLREAEKAGNAARVASFFNGFKKIAKKAPGDSINKRIAPDSTASPTTDLHTNTGTKISAAYIDKFFSDVTKGLYKGKYTEQMAIQAKIDEAYMAGNITN